MTQPVTASISFSYSLILSGHLVADLEGRASFECWTAEYKIEITSVELWGRADTTPHSPMVDFTFTKPNEVFSAAFWLLHEIELWLIKNRYAEMLAKAEEEN